MASNRFRAIAISLAVALAPVSAGQALAQQQLSPAQVQAATRAAAALIQSTVRQVKFSSAYISAAPAQKAALLQQAVAGALSGVALPPAVIAQALLASVQSGLIPAQTAVQVVNQVAPTAATVVTNNPVVQQQIAQQQIAQQQEQNTPTVNTASNTQESPPTILLNLQSVSNTNTNSNTSSSSNSSNNNTNTNSGTFDPCANASGPYCG